MVFYYLCHINLQTTFTMKTFRQILAQFRQESVSEKDKGYRFERLMQLYLKTTSLYQDTFENVWLWNDFPYRRQFGTGQDVGIDMVARTREGDFWAVQCKCYNEGAYIDKPAVDSFITTSGKTFTVDGQIIAFAHRLWISTTNNWSSHAETAIQDQHPPVSRLNLIDLEEDDVCWERLEQGLYGKQSRYKPFEVREHQRTAIERTHKYFQDHERGKLIMACGTGKTFTSLKIAEKEAGDRGLVLFLVPSISLMSQTLRSWKQQAAQPLHAVCICSDPNVSRIEPNKNDTDDLITMSIVDLALPASTRVDVIVSQLKKRPDTGMTVVFSTYQSIEVISKAQRQLLTETNDGYGIFDLIICDEAHRTTGVTLKDEEESNFVKVHDEDFLRAQHRLYMTATPRLYTDKTKKKAEQNAAVLCSMDDPAMYGDEIYRIGFGEAVDKHLLTDYKVLILAMGEKELSPEVQKALTTADGTINADDASKLVGCLNALSKRVIGDEGFIRNSDPQPMKRAVAFCQSIKRSRATANVLSCCKKVYLKHNSQENESKIVDVEAHHVDGTMSATKRDSELMWLKSGAESNGECRVLTNARCLSEGVDVPSLDAVIFVSPKNSQVDVVQSVGRVMRISEGKQYGYIIIPVVVPADADGDKVLENHPNFKVVWEVLNALRAHDDRFNAEVNKIELSKKKPKNIIFGRMATDSDLLVGIASDSGSSDYNINHAAGKATTIADRLTFDFKKLQNVFYAKMVMKVGTKRYWEQWAKDIADIAKGHIHRIECLISEDDFHCKEFDNFMIGLRKNLNPGITKPEAIEMLSQHIISKPVFEALFKNYEFAGNNPVSKSIEKILKLLDSEAKSEVENEKLQKFYDYVRTTVGGIEDAEGRQRIIVELYDKFFKTASPKAVEKLGIVYTPVEVVDFIIHSVDYLLRKEFKRTLSDENVHILDPFTGTGTFITRLLQSGLIKCEDMERKYDREIHANEIVLMAYYIASINIENVYHDIMQLSDYCPFKGICLTDTFQLGEDASDENLYSKEFPTNSSRVIEQKKQPITVIIGNPPYSVGQKSANDNAQNQSYPFLQKRIYNTYAQGSGASSVKALLDSYIKAFRWASDRLNKDSGGIIAYITNSGWLDKGTFDGFRKSLEKEFDTIYVVDLRGGIKGKSGEIAKKEGQNVFDIMTGVAITILVKKPNKLQDEVNIFYYKTDDYLKRRQKLDTIKKFGSVDDTKIQWKRLNPNKYGDWIDKRSEIFSQFIPLKTDTKFDRNSKTFFTLYTLGINTNRDTWMYNFSLSELKKNIANTCDFYNEQVDKWKCRIDKNVKVEDVISTDKTKIKWSSSLIPQVEKGAYIKQMEIYAESTYRPFCKQNLYLGEKLIHRRGQNDSLFPTPNHENRCICVSSDVRNDFSVLMVNHLADLNFVPSAQCFPLYWYDASNTDIINLFSSSDGKSDRYVRQDGISKWIQLKACAKYHDSNITKEDIFYYVYGFLHSPEYRMAFAADLKKSLPRIPLVDNKADFLAFSSAGRTLAELHLNYETITPYKKCLVKFKENTKGQRINYRVEKMCFAKKNTKTTDKSIIYYNNDIIIKNIPLKAYEYVLNGKLAIEWIMERYQVTVNKESQIRNDPNDWAVEHNDEKYIFNLLLRIITVSIKTMEIVARLPCTKMVKKEE